MVSARVTRVPNSHVGKSLQQQGPWCGIAPPVWHELVWVEPPPVGKRRAALEEYRQPLVRRSFAILPHDEAASDWHARERARLEETVTFCLVPPTILPFSGVVPSVSEDDDRCHGVGRRDFQIRSMSTSCA
jgi:hypothetical protein